MQNSIVMILNLFSSLLSSQTFLSASCLSKTGLLNLYSIGQCTWVCGVCLLNGSFGHFLSANVVVDHLFTPSLLSPIWVIYRIGMSFPSILFMFILGVVHFFPSLHFALYFEGYVCFQSIFLWPACFEHEIKEEGRWGEMQPLLGSVGLSLFPKISLNGLYQGTLPLVAFELSSKARWCLGRRQVLMALLVSSEDSYI